MTKARDLANLISTGNPLADGALAVAEVTGAAPLASPTFTGTLAAPTINASTALQIGGTAITATAAELNGVTNINSNVQTQLNLKAPLASPTFTGDVTLADKIVHTSDTNTAIRFPSNDTVSFETGGSERFRFASAGQLGIGGATYGTSGQVLTSGGASAAPTWADASSGGMTQITSGTIGTNAQYDFSLGSNWWNTYKYIKIIYLSTFQSGDPPSGTYQCQFRLNGVTSSIYVYAGQKGSSDQASTQNAGRLTGASPQDNQPVFIQAEIFSDGTHTYVSSRSGSGQQNGAGFVENFVPNQTPTTFNIVQNAFGSERYRFEGTITFYGVN